MRFDLHIHSDHSPDSALSVDDILGKAMEKGLDGIAVCDHNTITGSYHARKRARELNLPLLVLSGIEVSTMQGHLIVLGVKENIPAELPLLDTIRIAKAKGGVTIAAHPFKRNSIGNVEGLEIDAVETFNSRCIFHENDRAIRMAMETGKPGVGGSDSHVLATIGLGYTEIDAEPEEESVLDAIRMGRTFAGGKIAPLYVVMFHAWRGFFRGVRGFTKK